LDEKSGKRMNYWQKRRTKYGAVKSWSELCQRKFDSKTEARRGEELWLLQKSGAISGLTFQKDIRLCDKPKISIKVDFVYTETSSGRLVHEDTKGVGETREFRVKRAWLKEKYGIDVFLTSS